MREQVLNSIQQDFLPIFQEIINNNSAVRIKSIFGSAVLVDEKTWNSMTETLLILQDKEALKALLNGHKNRDIGISNGTPFEELVNV